MNLKFKSRIISVMALLSCFASTFFLAAQDKPDPRLWEKANAIHREALVVDTHTDTPMAMLQGTLDIGKRSEKSDIDLLRMKEGGLDAVFFAVFVSNRLDKKQPSLRALDTIDEIYSQVERYPQLSSLAFTTDDIRRNHLLGKQSILLGLENGGPIEGNIRLLRNYYRLGIRYVTLTHNDNNDICDSATSDKPQWNGLSPFGKEVVKEMNRLGMIIDVSHISDKAFWDVLEVSSAPVMASHSCVRAICHAERNLTDDMIRALAKQGGVMQLNFFSGFLDDNYRLKTAKVRKRLAPQFKAIEKKYKDNRSEYWKRMVALWKKNAPEPPDIEILIDHIDHVVKLVGADYVGLGSDFDGAGSFPKGLEDVTGFPLITYHLLKRGYKTEDIKKILGGNFMRVFAEVEARREKN